jgi:hypothetical protein
MLFNGQYVNVRDSFIDYISMIDEYHEQGGEIEHTVRQAPFKDAKD